MTDSLAGTYKHLVPNENQAYRMLHLISPILKGIYFT